MQLTNTGNNTTHSVLSASAAHRWGACPASAFLSTKSKKQPAGRAAREGTGLHSLLEDALINGKNANDYSQIRIEDEHGNLQIEPITSEQQEALQAAINYANSIEGELFTEERIKYGNFLDVPDDIAFGTGDISIISRDNGITTLHIIDAKFGRGYVNAYRNPQLMLYAIGMLDLWELLADIDEVALHIIQPRVSHSGNYWKTTPQELREAAQYLKRPAKRVFELVQDNGKSLCAADFNPDDDACQWCEHAPCQAQKALAEKALNQYHDQDGNPLGAIIDEQLGDAMTLAQKLKAFIESVETKTKDKLHNGEPVKGYKLVKLRVGSKKWKADLVEADLVNLLAMDDPEDLYEPPTLKTPSKVLAMFKIKRGDSPEEKDRKALCAEVVSAFYTQGADTLSVVSDSDPREAYVPNTEAKNIEGFEIG